MHEEQSHFAVNNHSLHDISHRLQLGIQTLSAKQSHIEIDLNWDPKLFWLMDKLYISTQAFFATYYNGDLPELRYSVKQYLLSLSRQNKDSVSDYIAQEICHGLDMIFSAQDKEYLWVYIDASNGSDKPCRWHTDVPFSYDASGGGIQLEYQESQSLSNKEFFVLFTLKGPSTLFYDLPSDLREEFAKHSVDRCSEKIDALINKDKIIYGKLGKAYITLNGLWQGCVHSRPPSFQNERLLVTAAGANEQEKNYLFSKYIN